MTDAATPEANEEDTEGGWDPESDPDGYTREDVQPKDFYLQTILDFWTGADDQDEGGIGLTLQLNGSLVSGIAISRKAWMDATLESITTAAGTQMGEAVGKVFNLINDKHLERYESRTEADLPTRRREFVHMKDVQVTVGGATEFYSLPLWRGALDDVTGWSVGSWNPPRLPDAPTGG